MSIKTPEKLTHCFSTIKIAQTIPHPLLWNMKIKLYISLKLLFLIIENQWEKGVEQKKYTGSNLKKLILFMRNINLQHKTELK
jgi:hypothetical protein